jgi:uncharacterized RDD family membrane protein YckC
VTVPAGRVSGHYAGAFTRLAAFSIDWFLIAALYGLLAAGGQWFAATFIGFDLPIDGGARLGWAVGLVVWAYLYLAVGLTIAGRTPGKSLLGLRVVTRGGLPIGAGRASVRVIAQPLSFLIFGLGLLGIVIGKERRALHDVIAGTAVVYDWGDRPAEMPAPLTRWLERRGVPVIPDDRHPGSEPRDRSSTGGAAD